MQSIFVHPMKQKIQLYFTNFYRTFPVQLLRLHATSQLGILVLWLILLGLITGHVGQFFGFQNNFLDPEYLGSVSYMSFFFIGLALSGMVIVWHTTSYTLMSYRFPFLASLSRPFLVFCLNNSIIPVIIYTVYIGYIIQFQWYNAYAEQNSIIQFIAALFTGSLLTFSIAALYFSYTNSDINKLKGKKVSAEKIRKLVPNKTKQLETTEDIYANAVITNTYFNQRFQLRSTRDVSHYNTDLILKVFKQNHLNSIIIQLFTIAILFFLGVRASSERFDIPAAASFILTMTVLMSFLGALKYWLGTWRTLGTIALLLFINWISSYTYFERITYAFGMNYEVKAALYNDSIIKSIHTDQVYEDDIKRIEKTLNKWKKNLTKGRRIYKPKLVVIASSGGGLRASYWTTHNIQLLDSITNEKLFPHTVLMTGASGGMFGAAYMRDVYLQSILEDSINLKERKYLNNTGKDLQNGLTFTFLVNDLLFSNQTVNVYGKRYSKDRGYMFDKALMNNTNALNHPLVYYRKFEEDATIPMMVLSPVSINDGKRIIISPLGMSYLCRTKPKPSIQYPFEYDGIDFIKVFKDQAADSLRFSTALRAQGTYPLFMPNINLPSEPRIELIDAGVRDNFGINDAYRFLSAHKDWIKKNTSGIVIISLRAFDKLAIRNQPQGGFLDRAIRPTSVMNTMTERQDFMQDQYLSDLIDQYGSQKVDIINLTYKPPKDEKDKVSMSLHLTELEKYLIRQAQNLPENQQGYNRLKQLIK